MASECASPSDVTDAEAMDRALSLALRGWGRVSPNPLVGAVVVREGTIVGEGWHAEFGGPHAEVAALAAAGEAARGATLVVTLEPCAHQGKQPPCTEAIVRAGIARVVAAVSDLNPAAAGGTQVLRHQGVAVETGLRRDAAVRLDPVFRRRFSPRTRPWVALKLATSLDGGLADGAGRSRWISGTPARDYAHWLRAGFEAIGVGGATARADDPGLTVRGSVMPRVPPRRVVFDRALDLPPTLQLVRTARETPTIVLGGGPEGATETLRSAGVVVGPGGTLVEQLRWLQASQGIESILIEGGGRLAGALLAADLVDRLYWIQAPMFLGGGAIPAFPGIPGRPLGTAPRWCVVERRALGEDTLLVVDREACSPVS